MKDLSQMTNVAILAALQAGDLLKKGFGSSFKIDSKGSKHNLVTEYDKRSEKCIIDFISSYFPKHHFLAEESGESSNDQSSIQWIIDPLDGTMNFAYNIPVFSVSIAAAFDQEVIVGVVFNPLMNELFVAEKGSGAFFNGKRMTCSKVKYLTDSFIGFGLPYNIEKNPSNLFGQISHLGKLGVPMRRLGSAAIDLAYVAMGRFDGFWETHLEPWDYAAGKLLIEEAGGTFTHIDGTPFTHIKAGDVLATNSYIHKEFISHLSTARV